MGRKLILNQPYFAGGEMILIWYGKTSNRTKIKTKDTWIWSKMTIIIPEYQRFMKLQ
jgi:hypothetical protein